MLSASFTTVPQAAEMYMWKDEKGVSHISDRPPPDGARNVEVRKYQSKPKTEEDTAGDKAALDRMSEEYLDRPARERELRDQEKQKLEEAEKARQVQSEKKKEVDPTFYQKFLWKAKGLPPELREEMKKKP